MKYDIFISYSRKDSKIVDEFVRRLVDEGFRVWVDKDGIYSGDDFKELIVKAIEESSLFAFFSSKSSNSSSWTAKEIGVAVELGIPIIPIKIDNAKYNKKVLFDLVNYDYISCVGMSKHESQDRLLDSVKLKLPERWREIQLQKSVSDDDSGEIGYKERKAGWLVKNKTLIIYGLAALLVVLSVLWLMNRKKDAMVAIPVGALSGVFSVNDTLQVFFSQGNLQYQASTNTWRFAENQWDTIGAGNVDLSESYTGWIDLFGWGTSGNPHGAKCYQPWSVSDNSADYFAYGVASLNLYDRTREADFGCFPIQNGGNEHQQWRTMRKEEWEYVFNGRNTINRYAKANVLGRNGIILFPDDWTDTMVELKNINDSKSRYDANVVDSDTWLLLEAKGVVFLPTCGHRIYNKNKQRNVVEYVNQCGFYWSSSCYLYEPKKVYGAYDLYFNNTNIYPKDTFYRSGGRSVRLVHNVK